MWLAAAAATCARGTSGASAVDLATARTQARTPKLCAVSGVLPQVRTTTTHPSYARRVPEVRRRFRDFDALQVGAGASQPGRVLAQACRGMASASVGSCLLQRCS